MERTMSSASMVPREPSSSNGFSNQTPPLDLTNFSPDSSTTQQHMEASDKDHHQDYWVDQPLTRDGRTRMRVFIACLPCRKNKRRCDGLRPICTICKKKGFGIPPSYMDSNAPEARQGYCIYDVVPKRRGPDRIPRSRLRRGGQIDDDERPIKRRHTIRGEIPKEEPRDVVRASSPNEEARPTLFCTLPSQDDRSSNPINLAVATVGHKWKRQDTENTTPLNVGYYHLQVPSTSVLAPAGTPSSPSSSSSSASRHFIHSPLPVAKGPLPSILVPSLDHEPVLRSVSSSKSYAHVSGHPYISSNLPLVVDPDPHYADYALPVSGTKNNVTTGSYPAPYLEQSLLPSSYDYRQQIPFIQQEECEDPTCKSCTSILHPPHPPQWDVGTSLPQSPSADYIQKTWYESLLAVYARFDHPGQQSPLYTVSTEWRPRAQSMIVAELRRSFTLSPWWTSFINVPHLFSVFHNPDRRSSSAMQPALVLAALALSVFFTGSETEGGRASRERAGMLRDMAQAAMESSLSVGWIDCNLAKAAWLLAMYEAQPHPSQSLLRSRSSIRLLDNLIKALGLTTLDAGKPNANTFDVDAMPRQRVLQRGYHQSFSSSYTEISYPPKIATVSGPSTRQSSPTTIINITSDRQAPTAGSRRIQEKGGCNCNSLLLSQNSPKSQVITPLWGFTPDWTPEWSEAEIEQEEARRLVWSSLILVAGHTSHAVVNGIHAREALELWLTKAENYALLYPGEALLSSADPRYDRSRPYCDTIWALYARAQLLWHSCLRMRQEHAIDHEANSGLEYQNDHGSHHDFIGDSGRPRDTESHSTGVMAQFAVRAWLETVEIEKKFNSHTCATEKTFLFHGREYLFNIRMCITYEFSRYVPSPDTGTDRLFNRHKAAEWLSWQARVSQGVMQGLGTVTGLKFAVLARRPFLVWWFMTHMSRCLYMWERDHSMTHALELCRAFLPPCEYLTSLWPSQNQQNKYLALRRRYDDACLQAGVALSA